jgi:hypothetical protein
MNVLIIRYRLDCILRLVKNKEKIEYLIYIRENSISILRTIVSPYLHPSMHYKLRLGFYNQKRAPLE